MQRYKGSLQHIQGYTPVVTTNNPTTKVEHTFDVEENFLNKYPVYFRGCYCCGYTDYYITKD